jgi:hypothetical protein
MKKVLTDVEVYFNCFLCSIKDYDTKEVTIWEISQRKNDFKAIKEFFSGFKGFLVSFNGIHYDNCIILWVLHNGGKGSVKEFLIKLKQWSDKVINEDFWWKDKSLSKYKYHNLWTDVDLFLYWSKMLRLSKKISLKSLAIQLDYPTIQELPYEPNSVLESHEIDELIHYNSVHDLGILELLLIKMEDEVRLRSYVKKEYGLNCMSFDAPKIASEILLQHYCKESWEEGYDDSIYQTLNNKIREIRSQRFNVGKSLELPTITFHLKQFEKLYKQMCKADRSFSEEINIIHNNTAIKLSYGIGGLHSVNNNEIYKEDNEYIIVTSDVASMYPNLIINYKLIRFNEILNKYIQVKEDRIDAKATGNKTKDSFLKLILNSTSGLIDNEHSWLYYPEGAMKLRLMGQLVLTVVIDRLVFNGFKVISANTDGIEAIIPKDSEQDYYDIVNKVGEEFNLVFEHEKYKKIVYQNVNSYICETYNTKKPLKQKGTFVEKPDLSNSVDFLIIPKALKAYFIDNVKVEDFVRNHKNIYDFCCSKKVDKSYTVTWTNPQGVTLKQQRLNRYYASTKGGYIMKNRKNESHHLLKSSGVMIYNQHLDTFPTDVNYTYYIHEINTIIRELENCNQLSLF